MAQKSEEVGGTHHQRGGPETGGCPLRRVLRRGELTQKLGLMMEDLVRVKMKVGENHLVELEKAGQRGTDWRTRCPGPREGERRQALENEERVGRGHWLLSRKGLVWLSAGP